MVQHSNSKSKEIKIVKEIKSKMIVREIKTQEQDEEIKEEKEEFLEDIVSTAPSGREFPEFRAREQEVPQTPSEVKQETKNATTYQITRDLTEEEIARKYRTNTAPSGTIMLRTEIQEKENRSDFSNRELEGLKSQSQEEKYEISIKSETQTKKRRYPWEA